MTYGQGVKNRLALPAMMSRPARATKPGTPAMASPDARHGTVMAGYPQRFQPQWWTSAGQTGLGPIKRTCTRCRAPADRQVPALAAKNSPGLEDHDDAVTRVAYAAPIHAEQCHFSCCRPACARSDAGVVDNGQRRLGRGDGRQ